VSHGGLLVVKVNLLDDDESNQTEMFVNGVNQIKRKEFLYDHEFLQIGITEAV